MLIEYIDARYFVLLRTLLSRRLSTSIYNVREDLIFGEDSREKKYNTRFT